MNKLMALVAVIGFTIVANDAQAVTRAQAARGKKEGKKVEFVALDTKGKTAVEVTTRDAAKAGVVSRATAAVKQAYASSKAWAVKNPKTAIAAGTGSAIVLGLATDAAIRKENSVLGKLWKKARRQARIEAAAN